MGDVTKRIAFLSYDWDYEIMSAYYEGMQAYLAQTPNVQLVIFHAFGLYERFELQDGAFNIFALCDYAAYDGFIVQGNRMWPPELRTELVNRIRALKKPVVSMNYELPGATYVGTCNYEAMASLVREVLTHGDRHRPAFVGGHVGSMEAQDRARAYMDVCAELGMSNARFYEAGWELEKGRVVAEKLLDESDDLPDVIFCCNDDLAAGVLEVLHAHGVRVPDDVFLSGFDNRENSLRAVPRITTVDRDYVGIGRIALKTIVSYANGEEPKPFVYAPAKLVLSPSCGYAADPHLPERMAERYYTMEHELKGFYELISQFQPAVLAADSLPRILAESEHYLPHFGCPRSALTLNANYLETTTANDAVPYGAMSLLMAASGFELPLSNVEDHVYVRFPSKELLPSCVPMEGQFYLVFPLRHNIESIGTMVVEGMPRSLRYGFLTFVLTLLSHSIASVRKRLTLQMMNRRLDRLYVHDHLTGLFNRFGLDRFGTIAYRHLLRDFGGAHFTFVDIDDMKRINDECGHEFGDQAIRDAAKVIEQATEGQNAFAMRYGGDEFLVISRFNLTSRLTAGLDKLRRNASQPYDLRLSMGTFYVRAEDGLSVNEAVERADSAMYEMKRLRKGRK